MDVKESKSYHALNISFYSNHNELKKILQLNGSWEKAWNQLKKHPADLPLGKEVDIDAEWQKLEDLGIKLVLEKDPDFPPRLKEIPWIPLGIYVKVSPLKNDEKLVAIVGTRKATMQGKIIARRFASQLSENGLTVVSGLALGIDAAAHEGALNAQGKTIAVLANGLDSVYPRQNEALAKKILSSGGSLISEYPPGTASLPKNFIERNRIVSGLSLGTILVEAPPGSGSLATARFALEQNREIFVVPGPIDNQNYAGSHELIKAGACLITSIDDVLRNLNLEDESLKNKARKLELVFSKLDENEKIVINVLKAIGSELDIGRISEIARMGVPDVNRITSFLVIKGYIKEENGKYSLSA